MSPAPGDRAPSLARTFLSGTIYLTAGNWVTFAFNFAVSIILARMLGPEAFGLYALVVSVNEVINLLQGFSFPHALLQSRTESSRLYDTAYTASAGLGLVGILVAGVAAPLLAALRSIDAAWFLLALGLGRALTIQSWVPRAYMERSLRYSALTLMSVVSSIVAGASGLVLAWAGAGVWSLVIRDVLLTLLMFVIPSLWSGYRPRFRIERDEMRQIMGFSRPMFWTRALDIVSERIDRLAIGVVLGDKALGQYQQARYIGEMSALATRAVNQLTFNLYSRLQDDAQRLRRAYELVTYFLARVTTAGGTILFAFPEELVKLLLGEAWLGTAPILRVLGGYAIVEPVLGHLKSLIFARGRPVLNVRIRLAQTAVFVPGVALATALGSTPGIALALVGSSIVGLALALRFNVDLSRGMLGRLYAVPLIAASIAVAGCIAASRQDWLAAVPEPVWVFLPPLAYLACLIAMEGRRLLRELSYLRQQFGGPPPDGEPDSFGRTRVSPGDDAGGA